MNELTKEYSEDPELHSVNCMMMYDAPVGWAGRGSKHWRSSGTAQTSWEAKKWRGCIWRSWWN